MPVECVLPAALLATARSHYLRWLRESHAMMSTKGSRQEIAPPQQQPQKKKQKSSVPLFRSHLVNNSSAPAAAIDPVQAEVNGWLSMPATEIENHRDNRGWLDEFALMSAVRLKFPIHCCVFKRTTSHYAHEADCESFFALVKSISDPNMFPSMLRMLSKVRANISLHKPSWEAVQQRYYQKYGKAVPEAELPTTNLGDGLDSDLDDY